MSFETISIIILVVLFAALLCGVYIRDQVANRRAKEEERQQLAAAREQERKARRLEARVMIIEQTLIGQLQEWSRNGIIYSFEHERASAVEPYAQQRSRSWRIEAAVRLVGNDGNSQAEWRNAVRRFAEKLSAEFSMQLRRTDIVDYRFDLHFSEEEPNDS